MLLGHEKQWSFDTWRNVDGLWEHDAQWEKPETEGHTVCDSIDGKRPEQANPETQRVSSWLSRAGEGDGGDCWWGWGFFWGFRQWWWWQNMVNVLKTKLYNFIFIYLIFTYLAAPGLSCSTWDLHCHVQDLLVVACKLLVATCGI